MDTLVAGVHFFENDRPDLIAKKALRVNLSDLAAMAAKPVGYLLSIALSKSMDDREHWIAKFTEGLAQDQAVYEISLWGGDTVSTPGPITISITAIGENQHANIVTRSDANAGDDIYVSGTLGDAAAGLAVIKDGLCQKTFEFLIDRYNLPLPRMDLALELKPFVTAMMDISDGLMGDMGHICEQSGVAAQIFQQKIPISEAFGNLLATKADYNGLVWNGGDDYELLFTANAKHERMINEISNSVGVKVTKIGRIFDGCSVKLLNDEGIEINTKTKGFRHF